MPKILKIRTIATSKLNEEYLTKDKNKDVLFIYDVEMMGSTKNKESEKEKKIKKLKNTLGLDFTRVENDKETVKNKKLIKAQVEILLNTSKKFKTVVMTTNRIGRFLLKGQLNKAHAYLRSLLRKYESTISIHNAKRTSKGRKGINYNNSVNLGSLDKNNNFGLPTLNNSAKKGKATNKKNPEVLKKLTKKIKSKVKEAINLCGYCNKQAIELKRPGEERSGKRYKSRVKKLVGGREYCNKCVRRCDSIKKYMRYIPEDKDLYAAQYPIMCRRDHENESKASRLAKQYKLELKRQFEYVNQ